MNCKRKKRQKSSINVAQKIWHRSVVAKYFENTLNTLKFQV